MNISKLTLLTILLATLCQVNSWQWVLTWSDDFNEGSLNTNNWNYEIGNGGNGWGNNELEYYTSNSDNIYISNGALVIQALQQDYEGFSYTSAKITTQNLFSTIYGKFEISAQLPYGQGMWPAFWMLGDNISSVGWPTCGEIDIMELIGDDPTQVHGSLHGPGYDETEAYTNDAGFSNGFHTYGVNWQPDNIQYYVDGNVYATYTNADAEGNPWVFDQNFFIILNLAVGGNWPGNPNSTTVFPQQFIIDYVKVWEIDWNAPGNGEEEDTETSSDSESSPDTETPSDTEADTETNDNEAVAVVVDEDGEVSTQPADNE